MITADDLAGMQDTLEMTMPDEMIIFHVQRTPDQSMGFEEAWVPVMEPVPCRLAPLAGGLGSAMAETLIAGRVGTAEAWIFSCPVATEILDTDRVTVDDTGYEVALVLEPRTWEINRRFVGVRLA